jgi:hypothetical protein
VITEANYLIAVPVMKGHAHAGVTLCGKLHFGSNLAGGAGHLHGGLVCTDASGLPDRSQYGMYRVQVDLMGHKDLGEKTVLFLVDALWATYEASQPPCKSSMAPFNNDWTSSLFVSQDQVAIESVCLDFLRSAFTSGSAYGPYPQMKGVDDYILQAADSSFWPSDIRYDPENDGTQIGSLGVCEHWNNEISKQYSRNLGTGAGIELVSVNRTLSAIEKTNASKAESSALWQNYPNPFNPTTNIRYFVSDSRHVSLKIHDALGREVATLVNEMQSRGEHTVVWNALALPSGTYFCRLIAGDHSEIKKLVMQK